MRSFGTDGIRGRVNRDVTAPLAMALGSAVTRELGPRVAVAHDGRPSAPMLEAALTAGIAAMGGRAVRLGRLPTPALAWLVATEGFQAGVMITASHNPVRDNGLKVFDARGEKPGAPLRARLEAALAAALSYGGVPGYGDAIGRIDERADATERYAALLLSAIGRLPRARLDGRRILVDAGNGAAFDVAPRVLTHLGAIVEILGDGDGARINESCGAVHPGALARAVVSARADGGIALDGDGDRVAVVDHTGRILDGDAILLLGVRDALERGAPPAAVVGTIMTNAALDRALRAEGIALLRTPVGDSEVAMAMRTAHVPLGGEPSGHILWADGPPGADGLYAGLRALLPDPRTLGDRLGAWAPDHQAHRTLPLGAATLPTIPQELIQQLERGGARVVVRASGTEPVVRIMVEHADRGVAEGGAEEIGAALIPHVR